jgi:tRNA1Val (adenine37-N6)-methyltransferase
VDKNNMLFENERLDDLQINNLKIIQNPNFFCFGIDAVLLSDFAKIKKNSIVLDLGTGTGIIPILLSAKYNAKKIIGLEIQKKCYDMAKRSINYNNLNHLIDIVEGDIKNSPTIFKSIKFDTVVSNPPYIANNSGLTNTLQEKSIARHEILCTLEDVISSSSSLLKHSGSFYMIHKPSRLTDIITLMAKYKVQPKIIRLISPYASKEPTMLMVQGIKGANPGLRILPNLIVYNADGSLSLEITEIYKNTN